jgi:hypothetical protein
MGFKTDTAVEAAVAAGVGQKTSVAGAGLGVVGGWVFTSDHAALAGVVIALVGLLINAYYRRVEAGFKREENERQRQEHEARMAAIKSRCELTP